MKYGVIVTGNDPLLLGAVALLLWDWPVELYKLTFEYTNREIKQYNVKVVTHVPGLFPHVPEAHLYPVVEFKDLEHAVL